mgnify:CR=1 FL=1
MTIKDLSAQTGYSVGTISRVLNNQPNVSEKARKVILEAAHATGFQRNTNAKQLKQQHSNSILVLVKGTSNQLFGTLVEEFQQHMRDAAHPLTMDYVDEYCNEVRRALQLCLEKKPRGILFLGGNRQNFLADFDKIGVPCVLVTDDAAGMPFPNLSSVSSDDRLASRMAVEALIAQEGLSEVCYLMGRTSNVEAVLKETDLYVMSSDYEGMPNALIEALAMGVPCISSDCRTGPKSLIQEGKTGLLFQTGNLDSLTEKMSWALQHPAEMNQMGRAAREDVLNTYKIEKTLSSFLTMIGGIYSKERT